MFRAGECLRALTSYSNHCNRKRGILSVAEDEEFFGLPLGTSSTCYLGTIFRGREVRPRRGRGHFRLGELRSTNSGKCEYHCEDDLRFGVVGLRDFLW